MVLTVQDRNFGVGPYMEEVVELSNYAPETHLNSLHELKLSSHYARILHGGGLHGGPHKPQNCQNWGAGPCSGMGACTGQYGVVKFWSPHEIGYPW